MPAKKLTDKNAEAYLNAMLQEAGLHVEGFDLERGWDVFIAFCKIPMKAGSDGMSLGWQMTFGMLHYGVTRQFEDERGHNMTHLHMEWQFDLEGEITLDELLLIPGALGKQEWFFAYEGHDIERLLREEQQTLFHQRLKQLARYQSFVIQELV